MPGSRKPIIHGRDHAPGGADPIPNWPTGGGGGGHTIVDETSTLPTRTRLAFIGPGVAATDSSSTDTTVVTISPRTLLAVWAGTLPSAVGVAPVFRVPYAGDGSSLTFNLRRAFARLETAAAGTITFTLERSAGGDFAFAGTTITTLTIAAGHYQAENASLSGTVASGDLLRLTYTAVSGTPQFQVELSGGEA